MKRWLQALLIVIALIVASIQTSRMQLAKISKLSPIEPERQSRLLSSPGLNDKTLDYLTNVDRPWFDPSFPDPPAMLLLTEYGWNQPNQTAGLEIYRGLRTRELVQAVVNHPWFHPTAWRDINEGRMEVSNTTRYYVFLDRETCAEKNYPLYNHGLSNNRDALHGRGECCGWREHFADQVMSSPLFRLSGNAKFVLFECGGHGPKPHFVMNRIKHNTSQLVFVSLSAHQSQHQPQDLGLPPPVPHAYNLTAEQRDNITTCREEYHRDWLLSFSGQLTRSQARRDLARLNHSHIYVRRSPGVTSSKFMHSLALRSLFSACPRGDNLFSYRLTEVMSCGSIPVVYSDEWVYPFSRHLLNWSEALVIIPEIKANDTLEILQSISVDQRCRMRQRVLEWYDKYLATGEATIRGIVESLELET